uniref:Glutathione transferase n=1 Tax=Norrisiella sphaerica TaxID=552664 RepID=A0A7S2VUP1_9EUKA|mmetsp:Transcript_1778/g.2529  ORF Transcript_1778/g.2529 Transcript_1778/m.2529 type:complete len:336 (+) Transcript_1778:81-1088(+)|eukprot:CAMPEP_0184487788 /NCGR_PEP_ID=MMETSP0113_2-20130426/10338_1 /TAXON_ID=91329 /ORGANISM="Norrisiella sphaerica, Strain BC52" /LENGTH=335 /DNA_ID=CAMNT_0026870195 /DNA_START=62 /DNA_END=1069 /DNA_ORIENTATION=+
MSDNASKTGSSPSSVLAAVAAAGVAAGVGITLVVQRALKYKPPKVWKFEPQGGVFGSTNRPYAGARSEKQLPKGKHPIQLYSLGTPNGVKITTFLEELADAYGIEYDAWPISISGDQFGSGFVEVNPNSKIPAMLDYTDDEKNPTRVFESASIVLYLCEKLDKKGLFMPKDPKLKTECMNWIMWSIGSAPYLGGGFGHFYNYAPIKIKYAIDRFTMEAKRQLDVLEKHLSGEEKGSSSAGGPYICGDQYTIADIMIWPWYGNLVMGRLYNAKDFLGISKDTYPSVIEWAERVWARQQVKRGRMVNRVWGDEEWQLPERHDASDFEAKPIWKDAQK